MKLYDYRIRINLNWFVRFQLIQTRQYILLKQMVNHRASLFHTHYMAIQFPTTIIHNSSSSVHSSPQKNPAISQKRKKLSEIPWCQIQFSIFDAVLNFEKPFLDFLGNFCGFPGEFIFICHYLMHREGEDEKSLPDDNSWDFINIFSKFCYFPPSTVISGRCMNLSGN